MKRKAALLAALILPACGDAALERQVAVCRQVIPALMHTDAPRDLVRQEPRPDGVRLHYRDEASGARRWLDCRFGPVGEDGSAIVLSGVTLDRGGRQSDITVMLLREFWLARREGGTTIR
ncbi:hypothetical protein [Marinivivus vitaminiproducens]|uniref:hypothetical protein n=1 Tax=Marinivivus vitaminiproducens TaxID=3035935 RepID=UPI0027A24BAD|nr:hypothetical protein P4R82_17465 [Geminicoccaceae bacterium SCSIO 64248]